MDHDSIERELSLHLDGRLPAARRDALMQALRDDPDARRLFVEMERARELALGLQQEAVGPSFQETLWQRIRAGEGSPEAMFREPVSIGTKLRYVAAGAAAAALVILAIRPALVGDPEPRAGAPSDRTPMVATVEPAQPERSVGEPGVGEQRVDAQAVDRPVGRRHVAAQQPSNPPSPDPVTDRLDRGAAPAVAATSAPAAQHSGLRPRGSGRYGPELVSLTPSNIARVTQLGTYEAVHDLRESAPHLERRFGAVEPADLVDDLEPQIQRVRGLSDLLRWMQRENLATLPQDFDSTLTIVERSIDRLERSARENDRRPLIVAVEDLKDLDPRPLQQNFQVACCIEPHDFLPQVTRHLQSNPRALGVIRLVRADDAGIGTFEFRMGGPLNGLDSSRVLLWIDGRQVQLGGR